MLHEDYQDCEILVFKSRFKYAFWFLCNVNLSQYKHLVRIVSGKVNATYDSKRKGVEVFLFNIEKYKNGAYSEFVKHLLVFSIYHELRHFYQDKYGKLTCIHVERDANRFATRMCNKNHDQINDIMGINGNWEFRL